VAAFTLALTTGAGLTEAADVAQLAATVATQPASARSVGTAVCPAGDLITAVDGGDSRVLDAMALGVQVAAHRARGRRIVFTNGCFDVLHSGHVGYLEQAKRLGDVLIVAVNSDESVRRLKGEHRPVNPVEDRVSVLSALSCVDHVVVFAEDSPAALLTEVRPDIYVKGGDYRPELIPEAPLVRQLGGDVRVLDYVPDKSTSKIIERIRSVRSPGVSSGTTG
jgi:rfaE bifunctional protein nucleotidyltransferase chain/domain